MCTDGIDEALARRHPRGDAILILGIVGIFVPLLGPVVWMMARRALADIRAAGPGVRYVNRGSVRVGRVLGIIASVVVALGVIATIIVVLLVVSGASYV